MKRKELKLSKKMLKRFAKRIEESDLSSFAEYVRYCIVRDLDANEKGEAQTDGS